MGYRANATTDECGNQLWLGFSVGSGVKPFNDIMRDKAKPPQLPQNMIQITDISFLFDEGRMAGDKKLQKYNFLASVALRKENKLFQVSVGEARDASGRTLYLMTPSYLYTAKLDGSSYNYWKI